jgi:predicted lipoprotein
MNPERKRMRRNLPWLLGIVLGIAFLAVLPFSVTIVPIAQVEAVEAAEQFDAEAFVGGIFASQVVPTVQEKAVELSAILNQFAIDDQGNAKKDELVPIAEQNGLITVGEAHVYLVKGKGVVTEVDTESRVKTMTVQLEGYDGPIKVRLYTGPRIPSDETSVRDAVGFLNFGDFRSQTEYGKVASELNKLIVNEVLGGVDVGSLVGKTIEFTGAFGIRTFNLIDIDLSQVTIVPVTLKVVE